MQPLGTKKSNNYCYFDKLKIEKKQRKLTPSLKQRRLRTFTRSNREKWNITLFFRKEETSEHLSACPVYDNIMHGDEFIDIHSKVIKTLKYR